MPEKFGELTVVDEQFVERAHASGLAVHVWTVNDEATMRSLLGLGVDGIISDTPTTLVEVLASAGCAWGGLS